MEVTSYKSLVFDCDGVILDSNKVKTDAFYKAALSYGDDIAKRLVQYHVENGGVSRYKKFKFLLEHLVPTEGASGPDELELLHIFSMEVRAGLENCVVARKIRELREKTVNANWLIVSGSDQEELNEIFREKKLDAYFDGGIYGSPDEKTDILIKALKKGIIHEPALFVGDSKLDYEAAVQVDLDFLFVSNWTEVSDWASWTDKNGIETISEIADLLD